MRTILTTVSFLLLSALAACDRSQATGSGATETGGEIAFRLSTADSQAVAGTVDSILVRAISAGDTATARAAFGQAVTLKGLAVGAWCLQASLFEKSGIIRWAGTETVQVRSGETTPARLVLMPATGSIRVEVVLGTPQPITESVGFQAMTATNFPYQSFVRDWNDSIPLLTGLIRSKADFDTCFGPAGVMYRTRPFAPSDSEFASYDYVLAARVVSALGGFAADSVRRTGKILSVYYSQETKPATGALYKDLVLVRLAKIDTRSADTLHLYENQKLVAVAPWPH